MQDDRIGALERVDRHAALGALAQQAFGGVQAGEIVQHPRQPRAERIDAVRAREQLGHPRGANDVRVAVLLVQPLAHRARRARERDAGQCRTSRRTLAPIARPPSFAGA